GFTSEHEPEDAEFPVLEAVDLGVGAVVEIGEGGGGDEAFAAAFASGEEEGDVGDLLGKDVDGAIDPDDLLVGVGEERGGEVIGVVAEEEGGGGEGAAMGGGGFAVAGDVDV